MSITIAVPTFNNPRQLTDALVSLVRNTAFSGRVIVVNNGADCYNEVQGAVPYDLDWINADRNLGWMGGVNEALEHADTDLFCMMNDDVLFPPGALDFWEKKLRWFHLNDVGGVGPSSNYVAGVQSAFLHIGHPVVIAPFLIGFCATYRTQLLKDLGGLDESLPGGDDLDLSIRVQNAGFNLVADRRCYLHHIGAQTGQRVHPGKWDSQKHQADTCNALCQKHGIKRWFQMMNQEYDPAPSLWLKNDHVRTTRAGMASKEDTVEGLFAKARLEPSDVNAHLDTLYRFASGCKRVVEFGVEDGTTTTAFLAAKPDVLESYDIRRHPNVSKIEALAAGSSTQFRFYEKSTLEVTLFDGCDFLYVDDLHTYEHVKQELRKHADHVRKYIALHDVALCRTRSEDGTTPGIWQAVAEFLRDHDEWRLIYTTEDLNGLVVLMRIR